MYESSWESDVGDTYCERERECETPSCLPTNITYLSTSSTPPSLSDPDTPYPLSIPNQPPNSHSTRRDNPSRARQPPYTRSTNPQHSPLSSPCRDLTIYVHHHRPTHPPHPPAAAAHTAPPLASPSPNSVARDRRITWTQGVHWRCIVCRVRGISCDGWRIVCTAQYSTYLREDVKGI